MGKPKICIGGSASSAFVFATGLLSNDPKLILCETKGADQFRGSCEAGQRPCFCYTDSTIFLLFKSEISNFLCDSADRFVSDLFGNHIADFLMTRLIYLFTYQWTVSKLVPSFKHLKLKLLATFNIDKGVGLRVLLRLVG